MAVALALAAVLPRPPACAPLVAQTRDALEDLIARGRAKLEQDAARDAQKLFDEAADIDGSTPRTRVWVVRGWIAQERFDQALEAADELKTARAPAADLDYLFGLAFFGKAKDEIARGTSGSFTQSELDDAAALLARATSASPERYRDAFEPLAEAAWYGQDLPTARAAIERALAQSPDRASVHLLRGRIALSQFVARKDDAADEAERDRASAVESFARAVALLGKPRDEKKQRLLADACVQLGDAHAWKEEKKEASAAYVRAMSWDPSVVDFNRVLAALGNESFDAELARARSEFAKHHEAKDPRAAVLAWWQGFARFKLSRWNEAERSFQDALDANPGFANAWYYLFRVRFSQQRYAEALSALASQDKSDPDGLTAALAGERELNVSMLRFLEAWCADRQRNAGAASFEDAAFVSGLLTRVQPDEPLFWNNLGLFLRDWGESLKPVDAGKAHELYERSYRAYLRALELAPKNPAYLNDTAVLLHYYLERDFEHAKELYQEAARCADEELARPDLPPEDKSWIQTAKQDSQDNLRKLEAKLRRGDGAPSGD